MTARKKYEKFRKLDDAKAYIYTINNINKNPGLYLLSFFQVHR